MRLKRTAARRPVVDRGQEASPDEAPQSRRKWLPSSPSLAAGCALLLVVGASTVAVGRLVAGRDGGVSFTPQVRFVDRQPPAIAPLPGAYVRARVGADGDVTVTHWIRSTTPLTGVDLALADVYGADTAVATQVVVAADHVVVGGPGIVAGTPTRYEFAAPAMLVYLHYVLNGVVEQSLSAPGRALIRLTSLSARADGGGQTKRVDVRGPVVSAACLDPAGGSPTPCGRPSPYGAGWSVTLTGEERGAQVQVQVNLDKVHPPVESRDRSG